MVVVGHVADAPYINGGGVGVSIFFVLSGFLITSLLMEERSRSGTVSFSGFYARRVRRLAPALIVMLAAVVGIEVAAGMHPWTGLLAACFYVANWAEVAGVGLGYFDHTWSLAVEEQFYLVWPVVLVLLMRRSTARGVACWCLVGAAASMTLRWYLWSAGASTQRIYVGTDTRSDALLVGCACAALLQSGWRPRPRPVLSAVSLAVLLTLGLWRGDWAHAVLGPSVTTLLALPVILGGLEPSWLGRSRILRWFGTRSYGLYLWHVPIVYMAAALFGFASPIVERGAGAVVAVGVAAASWRLVESPILRHRRQERQNRAPDLQEPGSVSLCPRGDLNPHPLYED
jgi:peptidoglycan/LPS O-acetylase OafA/YrhL